uniref:DUF4126 domain-containing protein n=1 Tax=Strongyloides stercoralis TaxID=6248 RepID=A0A0K0EAL3_STRER
MSGHILEQHYETLFALEALNKMIQLIFICVAFLLLLKIIAIVILIKKCSRKESIESTTLAKTILHMPPRHSLNTTIDDI